jgi:GT2 family glycosyltransferase
MLHSVGQNLLNNQSQLTFAVCIACFNRREKTLLCLKFLSNAFAKAALNHTVFLLDDASTDGTAKAIAEQFPQVNILFGDGNHYWAGGMRAAYGAALKQKFDYFIWLNDDVLLEENSIATALQMSLELEAISGRGNIIVGAMRSPTNQAVSYSGMDRKKNRPPWWFQKLEPWPDRPRPCTTINGNFVLIPSKIALKLGNIADGYVQTYADIDLGLAAGRAGFQCWIAPGYLGQCSENLTGRKNWKSADFKFQQRLMMLNHPLGSPWRARWVFARRNFPLWTFAIMLSPYISLFASYIRPRSK